jgi:hypothetical protein
LDVILVKGEAEGLSVSEIGQLHAARISIGPVLMRCSAEQIGQEVSRNLEEKELFWMSSVMAEGRSTCCEAVNIAILFRAVGIITIPKSNLPVA